MHKGFLTPYQSLEQKTTVLIPRNLQDGKTKNRKMEGWTDRL